MLAVKAIGLTKHFGRSVALQDCDLDLPAQKVIGVVGPNGAGKTTLLQLAAGLRYPTSGSMIVLDRSPRANASDLLPRLAFIAQDRPLYGDLTVAETLEMGRQLNVRWDHAYALARVERFRVGLDTRVRSLSTGQRAQVAVALALAKRPELVLLDEPVANLDPLARLELLEELMAAVADGGMTMVMSANAIADIDRVCDYLVILLDGKVRLTGDIEEITAQHRFVSGPREHSFGDAWEIVDARQAERQGTWLLRALGPTEPIPSSDGTVARPATLEEIVLAYLRAGTEGAA
ncbi:MAG: ABC transporter ATP-binding protein [Chloroflexota bacterium]|nr:ABC transporter ATP-binding protein [Chloroflexota bacterium]